MDKSTCLVAVEDQLSKEVAFAMLKSISIEGRNGPVSNGKGNLKNNIDKLNKSAKAIPILLLTDLDRCECPSKLITAWIPGKLNEGLIFRVASREIEAWVFADRTNFSDHFRIPENKIPTPTDQLDDPKCVLLELVRKYSSRAIKDAILPRNSKGTARVGPEYNLELGAFVAQVWQVTNARLNSLSLQRTMRRLEVFFGEKASGS